MYQKSLIDGYNIFINCKKISYTKITLTSEKLETCEIKMSNIQLGNLINIKKTLLLAGIKRNCAC